jgi:hypothetical protein
MIQSLNDSGRELSASAAAWRWLVGLNGVGALISAGFAIAGLLDPAAISAGPVTALVRLYAGAYAVRAIPLTAVLLLLLVRRGPMVALVPLLVVAGLAQVGDAVIGIGLGQPGMLAGGSLLAAVHLLSAGWLHRRRDTGAVSAYNQPRLRNIT